MTDIDVRMKEYTSLYMEKVFYFCLRKTGDRDAAEDLTQDISLCVLAELRRGVIPQSFSAWVWQIARNRYARWVDGKRRRSEREADVTPEDCELADETSLEEEYIHRETLSLLRRELAFIAADYRDIVVAYYIDDLSVGTIASQLSIPVGTVKARLFRARRILKEGMNMAREFGKRSYKPENISFVMSGAQGKAGEPCTCVHDLLSKNILIASYERPLTAADIAVETGVALPYVQDRLETLKSATLIRQIGERYAPTFCIISREAQERVIAATGKRAAELADAMIDLIETEAAFHEANGCRWHEGYQDREDMKWVQLIFYVDDQMAMINSLDMYLPEADMSAAESNFSQHFTNRPNAGAWELLGCEMYESDTYEPDFVGMNGALASDPSAYEAVDFPCFWQAKFEYHGIASATPVHLSEAEARALVAVARGRVDTVRPAMLNTLKDYGYIAEKDGAWVPTFYVRDTAKQKAFTAEQTNELSRCAARARAILSDMRREAARIIADDVPAHVRAIPRSVNYAISSYATMNIRGYLLEAALEKGYIRYGDGEGEAKRRMLGAYLSL